MSRIVTCEPWHLIYVSTHAPAREIDEALAQGSDIQTLAARRAVERGVRFTVMNDAGEPKVCFGIAETGMPGVGELWMFRGIGAERYAKLGHKTVREIVAAAQYRRIEVKTKADCAACRKFVEWLGFAYEGTKKSFFLDGTGMHLFAIVR